MSTLLHTYILLIGCLSPIMLFAQKHYTKQSVYPITNFAWDENHAEAREPNGNKMEKINGNKNE